jgi:Kazal-type serine protease inhibitor domain
VVVFPQDIGGLVLNPIRAPRPALASWWLLGGLLCACNGEEQAPSELDAGRDDSQPPLHSDGSAGGRDGSGPDSEVDAEGMNSESDGSIHSHPACPSGTFRPVGDPAGECMARSYTVAACTSAGGVAIADPGDGSVTRDGCPRGLQALGTIDAGWDEGGLCCRLTALDCASQQVHFTGSCEPAGRYYWLGGICSMLTGCDCIGADCDAGFASEKECQAAYLGCNDILVSCGGWQGSTCTADEFCAYRPMWMCGAADASAVCQPRPSACDQDLRAVCGCDGETYANECSANAAGQGIYAFGACGS